MKRITVPRHVGYANHSGLREPGAAADVPKAFRDYELSGASPARIERETGFSRDKIRKVWNFSILALFTLCLSARAADINAGYSWTPNDRVTSAKLNSVISGATINTTFTSDRTAALPVAADTFQFYQATSQLFRKSTFGTMFLNNTNLIVGQSEDTQPTAADFFLSYDASANSLKRVNWDSLVGTNSGLINTRSNWAGPANIANGMTLLGAFGGLYYQFAISNLLTFTNLANCNIQHANHQIQIWDVNFGTNRSTTLNGLITNSPSGAFNGNAFVWGCSNGASGPRTYTSTNIAHFVAQQYVTANLPVPTSGISYTNAHGLTGLPQFLSAHLVCTNAELGYAVGSEVDIGAVEDINANRAGTLSADASNLYFSSEVANLNWSITSHATAPSRSNITKANWNIKFQAIFFP